MISKYLASQELGSEGFKWGTNSLGHDPMPRILSSYASCSIKLSSTGILILGVPENCTPNLETRHPSSIVVAHELGGHASANSYDPQSGPVFQFSPHRAINLGLRFRSYLRSSVPEWFPSKSPGKTSQVDCREMALQQIFGPCSM